MSRKIQPGEAAADRRRYEAKKAEGVCAQCGVEDTVDGKVVCSVCAPKMAAAAKARYHRQVAKKKALTAFPRANESPRLS